MSRPRAHSRKNTYPEGSAGPNIYDDLDRLSSLLHHFQRRSDDLLENFQTAVDAWNDIIRNQESESRILKKCAQTLKEIQSTILLDLTEQKCLEEQTALLEEETKLREKQSALRAKQSAVLKRFRQTISRQSEERPSSSSSSAGYHTPDYDEPLDVENDPSSSDPDYYYSSEADDISGAEEDTPIETSSIIPWPALQKILCELSDPEALKKLNEHISVLELKKGLLKRSGFNRINQQSQSFLFRNGQEALKSKKL